MGKHPDADGLRISVRGGGCSGLQYDFAMDSAHERDKVVEIETKTGKRYRLNSHLERI